MNKKFFAVIITLIFSLSNLKIAPVYASTTDGTIDSTYKYAWSENIGWINFGATNGSVHITDTAVTGYAWSQNYGWINLNPTNGGVTNDSQGNLSGYAWGENLGWINFSGVAINSLGEFSGTATGDITGQISFSCTNCGVKTDWRPHSARGGGGAPGAAYNPPAAPASGFTILINGGDSTTNNRSVSLTLNGGSDAARMAISNFFDFRDASQETYLTTKVWDLCAGVLAACPEGPYTVYAKFYTQYGQPSSVVSDGIQYLTAQIPILPSEEVTPPSTPPLVEQPPGQPLVEKPKTGPEKIFARLPKILEKIIPGFLKPKPAKEVKPLEEIVSKTAPVALRSGWELLPEKPIREFVLAPLPSAIAILTEKFPQLKNNLADLDINKISDLGRLQAVDLKLPGLTAAVGLPTTKMETGRFILPEALPVAKLSLIEKQKMPTEVVFAKTGAEKIDLNPVLSISDQGETQQKIETLTSETLRLVIKPSKPTKKIKGYLVFRSREPQSLSFYFKAPQPALSGGSLSNIIGSLTLANPLLHLSGSTAFSLYDNSRVIFQMPSNLLASVGELANKPEQKKVENKLVLLEFEYTDEDKDGIYTADIRAPRIDGEYEILTVIDYQDSSLASKEIKLIAVVDPEGYIYEKDGDKETRIPGAVVSLYWLNIKSSQYELWPADNYSQENPQTTDVRGTYSFLVPNGYYSLKVEAPGYLSYDGKPFLVKEGSGVHINIEMKPKYWWLKFLDWDKITLAVVILLLLYNFYRDRMRDRRSPPLSEINHF